MWSIMWKINNLNLTDDQLKAWIEQVVDFDPIDTRLGLQIQDTVDAPIIVPRNPA